MALRNRLNINYSKYKVCSLQQVTRIKQREFNATRIFVTICTDTGCFWTFKFLLYWAPCMLLFVTVLQATFYSEMRTNEKDKVPLGSISAFCCNSVECMRCGLRWVVGLGHRITLLLPIIFMNRKRSFKGNGYLRVLNALYFLSRILCLEYALWMCIILSFQFSTDSILPRYHILFLQLQSFWIH